ncbi:tetraspanin-8 [Asbolus verrucosus]|uniref:Tetraspanin n=1 Tax=Asbolus verrucosus TaxID=1661398 RepID=A0A482WEP1_ASBVE|nr:tetraspanin-8 [Asbolus verrucosus]
MGCISGIAKYLLFFFNFLIVVCGIVLIVIGAITIANENKGIESFTSFSVGGFAIAVGVIIFAIAFFGCCGAIKENSCMLTTYAIILIVLLILQIVLGALAFVAIRNDDNSLDKEVKKIVRKLFEEYFNDRNNKDKKEVIDSVQEAFECCGIDGPQDWPLSLGPPKSCYKDNNLYKTGCAEAFQDVITYNLKVIGGVAIAFAVVEFIGAAFAFIVRNRK